MNRIRELRERHKMTQDELAGRMGLTGPSVAKWELGRAKPTADNLERLADIFGCSIDYILGRDSA